MSKKLVRACKPMQFDDGLRTINLEGTVVPVPSLRLLRRRCRSRLLSRRLARARACAALRGGHTRERLLDVLTAAGPGGLVALGALDATAHG